MLRTVLFWLHLVAGVVAGTIILVMSVTGVLLTYEKQVVRWADMRHLQPLTAPASAHLPVDSLVTLGSAARGAVPSAVTLRADPTLPATLVYGREGILLVDPATGTVLGTGGKTTREFFGGVTGWHRWLAGEGPRRGLYKSVTGAANLAFLVLILTGLVLWIPKTWTWIRVRSVLWFRSGLSTQARDFNWHNVLGIWSAIPLVVIVSSATVIGYPWASDLVYKLAGETPPPRSAGAPPVAAPPGGERRRGEGRAAEGSDALSRRSQAADRAADGASVAPSEAPTRVPLATITAAAAPLMPDWKILTVQLPRPDAKSVTVTLDRGTGGQPQHRATATIAAATGIVEKYAPFDSLSTGRQLRSVLRFAHTGEVLGITGQTIAGLVSLASVVLVMTGIALAVRRADRAITRRRVAKRRSVLEAPAPAS